MRFLLDTSVLTRLKHPAVRSALAAPVSWRLAGRASITDLELGHSARTADEHDRIITGLAELVRIDVTTSHIKRAVEVQRELAAQGLRGRAVPDLIIAAVAEDTGATVVHYDRDFDHIAAVTGQSVRWVVPAGTVD